MTPLPPGQPNGLYDIENELRERIEPTKPHRVCALLQADLPPAGDWTNCIAWVSDIPALAVSDGTDWIRTDTGAPI